jgi:hypothetical protein
MSDRIREAEERDELDRAEGEAIANELLAIQQRKAERREAIRQALGAAIAEKHVPPEPKK